MKKQTILLLLVTHLAVGFAGFAGGIYALPILTAPQSPDQGKIQQTVDTASYTGEFHKDLKDSDLLHWGEGTVYISRDSISLVGSLAPGPDYKLYLSPEFVETEADFNRLKSTMVQVGDIKTFDSFMISVSEGIDPAQYTSVIIWCESFGQFITAAKYR